VTDSTGAPASKSLSLMIVPRLNITTSSLPNGTVGTAYSTTVAAASGTGPYTWSISSGQLPAGLALTASSGAIAGTPTTAASYTFTVQVSDSGGQKASQSYTVSIAASSGGSDPIATNNLALAYIGQPYNAVLKASGSTSYTWTVSSGTLAPGLSLSSTTGEITGTPTQGGSFSATLTAKDSSSATSSKTFTLQVFEQPLDEYGGFTSKPCLSGPQAHFYTQKINNRWFFCTPAGNTFWMTGVFNAQPVIDTDYQGINNYQLDSQKYASGPTTVWQDNWAYQQANRAKAWGLNTWGDTPFAYLMATNPDIGWRNLTSDSTIPLKLPFLGQIFSTFGSSFNRWGYAPGVTKSYVPAYKKSVFTAWTKGAIDPFDPNFGAWISGHMADAVNGPKNWYTGPNSSYFIGIVGDESDDTGAVAAGPEFQTVAWGVLNGVNIEPHYAWMTLISSPLQSAISANESVKGGSPNDLVFGDPWFYAKLSGSLATPPPANTGLANWLQQTGDKGPGYTSIAALNLAWGSNYDSFGSDGVTHTDTLCGGQWTGAKTSCTQTLSNLSNLTPMSMQVFVNGGLVAGDDGSGPRANPATSTGSFRSAAAATYPTWQANHVYSLNQMVSDSNGQLEAVAKAGTSGSAAPAWAASFGNSTTDGSAAWVNVNAGVTTSASTVTYNGVSAGSVTITFSTPPPSGSTVKISYTTGGWGSGHGLLDEDGTCPAKVTTCWVPADAFQLAGANSAFLTDMDNFLYHYSRLYYSTLSQAVKAAAPGTLFTGDLIGSWGVPPRAPVLEGASPFVDYFQAWSYPTEDPNHLVTDDQARTDYAAQYAGDKPWVNYVIFSAQADSYMSPYPTYASGSMFTTQAGRGQYYQSYLNTTATRQVSAACNCPFAGTYPFAGIKWWDWMDSWGERANWGFITWRDDPYDGSAATTSQGYDSWGYPTGCAPTFGCEKGNYGDFLDSLLSGNLNALRTAATAP
jgi:hypothetical protein